MPAAVMKSRFHGLPGVKSSLGSWGIIASRLGLMRRLYPPAKKQRRPPERSRFRRVRRKRCCRIVEVCVDLVHVQVASLLRAVEMAGSEPMLHLR